MQNITLAKPFPTIRRSDDEMSVRDVVQFLKDGKRWIVGTILLCLLLGGAYALFAPARYEASANIEMATVAGTAVEAPNILAEKLKLPLYYSATTYQACHAENELPSPGEYLVEALKPAVNKNAPIVNITFRGKSADIARDCLASVIADVKRNQGVLLKPILDTKKSQLFALQQKLEIAEKLITLLPVKNKEFVFDDPKFSGSALLLATLLAKESEIKDLRNQINDMQIALAEPQTKGTSLVTPIYAPDIKAEPKPLLVLLSSAIAGIFLGILLWAGKKTFSGKENETVTARAA